MGFVFSTPIDSKVHVVSHFLFLLFKEIPVLEFLV